MCISDILTELLGGEWTEIEGPSTDIGIDRWFQNENLDEACVNENKGVLTVQKEGNHVWSGLKEEFDE